MGTDGTRGILNPVEGFTRFALERKPPPSDLTPFVEGFWTVRWELEEQAPFEQEILPYPCVNLSLGDGAFEVHGPGTQRFVAQLSGRGSGSCVGQGCKKLRIAWREVNASTGQRLRKISATTINRT